MVKHVSGWKQQNVLFVRRFRAADVRTVDGLKDVFFRQFAVHFAVHSAARPRRRLAEGLRRHGRGRCVWSPRKLFANSARLQDILAFQYYDFKRRKFSAEEILLKEQGLRRQMQLWDEQQLHDALCEAGFEPGDIQRFWQRYMFVGLMAVKRRRPRDR